MRGAVTVEVIFATHVVFQPCAELPWIVSGVSQNGWVFIGPATCKFDNIILSYRVIWRVLLPGSSLIQSGSWGRRSRLVGSIQCQSSTRRDTGQTVSIWCHSNTSWPSSCSESLTSCTYPYQYQRKLQKINKSRRNLFTQKKTEFGLGHTWSKTRKSLAAKLQKKGRNMLKW